MSCLRVHDIFLLHVRSSLRAHCGAGLRREEEKMRRREVEKKQKKQKTRRNRRREEKRKIRRKKKENSKRRASNRDCFKVKYCAKMWKGNTSHDGSWLGNSFSVWHNQDEPLWIVATIGTHNTCSMYILCKRIIISEAAL